jgi:uncharacterized protein (DUF1697 family)
MGAMPTHVALLRGINVGGRNKVAMSDLRELFAGLGHTDVVTYIQSGNVVFTAAPGHADEAAMSAATAAAITAKLAVRPEVVILTKDSLAAAARANPFPAEPNPKFVHAVFFPRPPGAELANLAAAETTRAAERGEPDEARLRGDVLYVHTPTGFGTSDLAARLLGKARGPAATGTARNWATVTKLLELCQRVA